MQSNPDIFFQNLLISHSDLITNTRCMKFCTFQNAQLVRYNLLQRPPKFMFPMSDIITTQPQSLAFDVTPWICTTTVLLVNTVAFHSWQRLFQCLFHIPLIIQQINITVLLYLLAQNQCVKELLSHKYIWLTECNSGTVQKTGHFDLTLRLSSKNIIATSDNHGI
jgi:hypothetical protein